MPHASESQRAGSVAVSRKRPCEREPTHGDWEWPAWFAAHPRERYPILVAEEGGRVAGWARLGPWSPRRAYDRTAENSVYVHPDFRGRGIGWDLMEALIALAPAAGIRVIIARIAEGNPASIALHEALGFKPVGVMRGVGEKFGRVLDVTIMQLDVDAPPARG